MLSFGKEVMTSCWKEERPTAGTPTVRRGSTQNLKPPLVSLESWGEEKEEVAVLALTWPAGPQSGTGAKGCCVAPEAAATPWTARGPAVTAAQTTLKESKFCH